MTSTAQKNKDGDIEWRNEKGQLHRENGPAVEKVDGKKEWWVNDQLHRENGPAIEYANGRKEWWVNDQLHRENGPAIERANGTKEWCLNGQSSPEIERQVKENVTRIQAKKEKKELLDGLFQDNDISAKINTCFSRQPKKL